jgi:hypothetical protein
VRIRADGSRVAWASPTLASRIHVLPAALLRQNGRQLTVDVPPDTIRYSPSFRWTTSAATLGRQIEIRDEAPNQGSDFLHPRLARFP